jgi:phosphoglycolate phosphatase-like HAD superfamily hydrolase
MQPQCRAGRAAGAVTVGVATGMYTVQQLEAARADFVLATLESPLPGIQGLQRR